MMKSIVFGSLLVLAMGSQVSFAVSGAHIGSDVTESVGSSPVQDPSSKLSGDQDRLGKPAPDPLEPVVTTVD